MDAGDRPGTAQPVPPCGELLARLPGISASVLAGRLRTLERTGVVRRDPGTVGAGVVYALTDRGRSLDTALRELRRWGARFLAARPRMGPVSSATT